MIKKGDVVTIKPEWRDPGDDKITFIACEDEDGGRVLIEPQIAMRIKPRQVVLCSMLEENDDDRDSKEIETHQPRASRRLRAHAS
jgi:hypothetical protein